MQSSVCSCPGRMICLFKDQDGGTLATPQDLLNFLKDLTFGNVEWGRLNFLTQGGFLHRLKCNDTVLMHFHWSLGSRRKYQSANAYH